jgi:hypothetical protein
VAEDVAQIRRDTRSMPAEIAAITDATPAKRPNKRRARRPFDRRYALGRRVKQLEQHFRARLGEVASDLVINTAIRRAAELVALSEAARARALSADPGVTMDDVVRLSRAADLAVRRLQLDRRDKLDDGPTLSDILRESWDRERDGGGTP